MVTAQFESNKHQITYTSLLSAVTSIGDTRLSSP